MNFARLFTVARTSVAQRQRPAPAQATQRQRSCQHSADGHFNKRTPFASSLSTVAVTASMTRDSLHILGPPRPST
jgi:hypothetical protein